MTNSKTLIRQLSHIVVAFAAALLVLLGASLPTAEAAPRDNYAPTAAKVVECIDSASASADAELWQDSYNWIATAYFKWYDPIIEGPSRSLEGRRKKTMEGHFGRAKMAAKRHDMDALKEQLEEIRTGAARDTLLLDGLLQESTPEEDKIAAAHKFVEAVRAGTDPIEAEKQSIATDSAATTNKNKTNTEATNQMTDAAAKKSAAPTGATYAIGWDESLPATATLSKVVSTTVLLLIGGFVLWAALGGFLGSTKRGAIAILSGLVGFLIGAASGWFSYPGDADAFVMFALIRGAGAWLTILLVLACVSRISATAARQSRNDKLGTTLPLPAAAPVVAAAIVVATARAGATTAGFIHPYVTNGIGDHTAGKVTGILTGVFIGLLLATAVVGIILAVLPRRLGRFISQLLIVLTLIPLLGVSVQMFRESSLILDRTVIPFPIDYEPIGLVPQAETALPQFMLLIGILWIIVTAHRHARELAATDKTSTISHTMFAPNGAAPATAAETDTADALVVDASPAEPPQTTPGLFDQEPPEVNQ